MRTRPHATMRRCATAFVVTLLATACGDVVTSEPEGLVEATSSIAPDTAGVDTDAEMQKLLLIEQSFSANARVITTIDALIQTLTRI